MNVSVIIPACNEEKRIEQLVRAARCYASEVIVVDDGSSDRTGEVAIGTGARVIVQSHRGYIAAIKRGFREARGDVVVTMDADGEHKAYDIPILLQPIAEGKADLVLGARDRIERVSERFLNWLTALRLGLKDSGTGFRAMRRRSALEMDLQTWCTCGTFALEADSRGCRIAEVSIATDRVNKKRRIAWGHVWQVFYIVEWLWRSWRSKKAGEQVPVTSV